jgi:hypothetical protein
MKMHVNSVCICKSANRKTLFMIDLGAAGAILMDSWIQVIPSANCSPTLEYRHALALEHLASTAIFSFQDRTSSARHVWKRKNAVLE